MKVICISFATCLAVKVFLTIHLDLVPTLPVTLRKENKKGQVMEKQAVPDPGTFQTKYNFFLQLSGHGLSAFFTPQQGARAPGFHGRKHRMFHLI